jgi:nucleotide-binding universal stress UspA family protein
MTTELTPGPLTVLVGIDGSPAADVAVELVERATWPAGSRIVVAQVISVPTTISAVPGSEFPYVDVADIEAELRAAAQHTLDGAVRRLRERGLVAEASVLKGRAPTALAAEATALGADLIVVGSRGHGTIETMLLGSVSAELVDQARTPVLVARTATVGRTVLAWDGSSGARTAASLLSRWPMLAASTVCVVTAADVGPPWWTGLPQPSSPNLAPIYLEAEQAARARSRELADTMAEELRRSGIKARPEVRDGDPAEQVLAAAASSGAELIVMGTHGRTGIARMVLGSVARNVLTHARCSVLVVRDVAPRAASAVMTSHERRPRASDRPSGGAHAYSTPWGDWP